MIFHKIKMWYTTDLPSNMKDFSTKERSSSLSVKAAFDRRRWMRRIEWDERSGPKLDNLKVKACAEECASNARFSLLSNHFKVSTTSYHSGRYASFDLPKLDLHLSTAVNGGPAVAASPWLGMKHLVLCRLIHSQQCLWHIISCHGSILAHMVIYIGTGDIFTLWCQWNLGI
jgi:hypothetical protein